jgi:DNA-binding NarL/FixJ family response regulator
MADVRVLIADDHPVVCRGIRSLLAPATDLVVIGEAYTGAETVSMVQSLHPDVLLLDMELPDISGVEVVRSLSQAGTTTRVLGLSSHDDRQFISETLSLGASGYLLKDEVPEQIILAIRGVASGQTGWLSRRVSARLSEILLREKEGGVSLTPREWQVLRLLVDAKTNGEIAFELGISDKTVEKHLETIFRKLGVASRTEAAVLAIREGLV